MVHGYIPVDHHIFRHDDRLPEDLYPRTRIEGCHKWFGVLY